MLAHPTLDLLRTLGLHGMAKGYQEIDANPEASALEHAEWLGMLLEHEMTLRQQKRFETRARAARLRHPASIEDVDYRAQRGLDRASFLKLAGCDWIRDPAQPLDHRAVRRRQELALLRARPQGLPGGSVRPLLARAAAVCRPGARSRRRPLCQAPAPTRPGQSARARRLGTGAAAARAGARPPGDRRGPLRRRLPPDHQPAAGRPLVRHHRQSRRWPTPCSIGSSTTPTGSSSPARACASARHRNRQLDLNPPRSRSSTTTCGDAVVLAGFISERRPASGRNRGRLQIGIPGRLRRNLQMDPQALVAAEGLLLSVEVFMQFARQRLGAESADVTHYEEHGVLHCGVGDAPKVPEPPRKQDIDEAAHEALLSPRHGVAIIRLEWGQEQHILEREAVLGVVEDMLQPRHQGLRGVDQPEILPAIKNSNSRSMKR